MIEEQGQIIALEGRGRVRVAVSRQSACGSCQARAACGQGLVQMARPGRCHEVLALSDDDTLRIGDQVVLGVDENMAVKGAVLVYLLPLLALLAGALGGQFLGQGEGGSIVLALTGFALSVYVLRRYNSKLEAGGTMLPVVLRVVKHYPAGQIPAFNA